MARIRTIKPEFFRHEDLQDLERDNPGKCVMLVFAGLWGHCDSKGRFEWRPRTLKLDILPFLAFDMAETLSILEGAGQVIRYSVDGREYGEIPSFGKHQRLAGKEVAEGEKYPCRTGEATGKQRGSVEEIPVAQEGKGREEEEEEEGKRKGRDTLPPASPEPTPQGEICRVIRQAGIPDGNPSHATLLALIEAGATVDEFRHAAFDAVKAKKPSFAYVVGVVKGRREDAAKLQLPHGAPPRSGRTPVAENFETRSYGSGGRL